MYVGTGCTMHYRLEKAYYRKKIGTKPQNNSRALLVSFLTVIPGRRLNNNADRKYFVLNVSKLSSVTSLSSSVNWKNNFSF